MPAPVLQQHSLVWGELQLAGPPTDDAFEINAMAEGMTMGNPASVVEIVRSLLTDGSLAERTGFDNRTSGIRLQIAANDGETLADAEAALFQQCLLDQPPPLYWTSPVDNAAVSVFDVIVGDLEIDTSDGWDQDEVLFGYRYYLLTLTCLPFARAVESTIVPALPVPADPESEVRVSVDTCGSATNWTIDTNGTSPSGPTAVTISGETAVEVSANVDSGSDYVRAARHFSTPLAVPADNYLTIDVTITVTPVAVTGPFFPGAWKIHDGTAYRDPVTVLAGAGEAGSIRLFFDTFAASISDLKVLNDFDFRASDTWTVTLDVFDVAYTDTLGVTPTSTLREQSRLASVAGSAPTQAAVRIYDATPAALGRDILVYSSRATTGILGLRQWITDSEPPVSDVTVSGWIHSLLTPTTFLIPTGLLNSGTYALLARMNVTTAGTLTWQARMVDSAGADTVGSSLVVSGEIDLDFTGGAAVLNIAALVLPLIEVESDGYCVEIVLSGTTAMNFDQGWLLSLDDGVLTWVRDDEELLTNVEIRSPELGAARPSVWGGAGVKGEAMTCIDWMCESFGTHRFEPGVMGIKTVTSTSLVSQCEIEYFPRYHSNVRGSETS